MSTSPSEDQIRAIAQQIYENRQVTNTNGSALTDWEEGDRIAKSRWEYLKFRLNTWLGIPAQGIWQRRTQELHRATIVELVELFGIIIAVSLFYGTEEYRRSQEIYNAWQTITTAQGQPGNGGRIRALEFLNRSEGAEWRRRAFPLSFILWPRESLIGVDVSQAYLAEIDLTNAELFRANLSETVLWRANLSNAGLFRANLSASDLSSIDLSNTVLWSADLSNSNLEGANLSNADIIGADLSNASLVAANFQNSSLGDANLSSANLERANLHNAHLYQVNLDNAELDSANLNSAYLNEANLSNTNLYFADLSSSILENTNLTQAILLSSDLRNAELLTLAQVTGENSPYLCNVALPDYIDVDPNRDCNALPQVLADRYEWMSLEEAQQFVDDARQKVWD